MKTAFNFLFSLILISAMGCAPNKSQQEIGAVTSKQEFQNNQKVKDNNSLVRGTYKGQIKPFAGGANIPVEIGFFEVLVTLGSNNEGENKIIPVLKARFRRLDTFQRYQIMDAKFFKENGTLLLSSRSTSSPGNSANPSSNSEFLGEGYSFDGVLQNGVFSAQASVRTGNLGVLEALLVNADVIAAPKGESNEFNQQLKEKMEKVAGEYNYKIEINDRIFTGTLNIVISLSNNLEYFLVGSLNDASSTLVKFSAPFVITYKPETSPEGLFFSKLSSQNDPFSFNFTGQVVGPEIQGNLITTNGVGTFTAHRK